MATISANLLDEDEQLVKTIQVSDERRYEVNDHFRAPDGGLYLVGDVTKDGAELSCIWFGGPHPASGVI